MEDWKGALGEPADVEEAPPQKNVLPPIFASADNFWNGVQSMYSVLWM
jgi:hypothetical protein